MYYKVNKTIARRLYDDDREFIVVPCKCGPQSMLALTVNDFTFEKMIDYSFDTFINSFTYYNCNYETGYYPAYYVKG